MSSCQYLFSGLKTFDKIILNKKAACSNWKLLIADVMKVSGTVKAVTTVPTYESGCKFGPLVAKFWFSWNSRVYKGVLEIA